MKKLILAATTALALATAGQAQAGLYTWTWTDASSALNNGAGTLVTQDTPVGGPFFTTAMSGILAGANIIALLPGVDGGDQLIYAVPLGINPVGFSGLSF